VTWKRRAFTPALRSTPGEAREAIGNDARKRPPCSARQPAGQDDREIFEHLLFEKRILRYDVLSGDIKPPQLKAAADGGGQGKEIFYLDSL
jgi:hypothetical protein